VDELELKRNGPARSPDRQERGLLAAKEQLQAARQLIPPARPFACGCRCLQQLGNYYFDAGNIDAPAIVG